MEQRIIKLDKVFYSVASLSFGEEDFLINPKVQEKGSEFGRGV